MCIRDRFNVIPAAVGLVLALAVLPVMEQVVNVILAIIGKVAGNEDPGAFLEDINIADIPIGGLLSAIVTFILIAFAVFMIVKGLNKAGQDTEMAATPDQKLLAEIRDALKK